MTLLDDIKEYTSPDFLFHIAEEEWIGAVPPELQLTSIPYQVYTIQISLFCKFDLYRSCMEQEDGIAVNNRSMLEENHTCMTT